MLLKKLLKIIENNLPAETAMDGDRIGLQVQGGNEEISRLLVTLEVTDEVIVEAGQLNCDCIITFHPLIFNPLKFIVNSERVGNLCHKLIKNQITLIAIHTNFDVFSEGTSKILSEMLELQFINFLIPDEKFKNKGMGVLAESKQPINALELLEKVHGICNSPIRFSNVNDNMTIDKIAIVGGSGSSFMDSAIKSGANAFITADITYHRFHEVNNQIMLIDPGHYEMEQFVPQGLAKFLKTQLDQNDYQEIMISKSHTNPIRYYPDSIKYEIKQKQYLSNIIR